MFINFYMVFINLIIAIGIALFAAAHPTVPNAIFFDEPVSLSVSIGMIILLFLPALIFILI